MTTEMSSTEDIIGRSEIDDFEAILSVVGTEEADGRHVVHSEYDSIFTWDYEKGARPALNKLYEKAKKAQWNGETDLPWETEVDQEAVVSPSDACRRDGGSAARARLRGHTVREVGRQGVDAVRRSRARTGCSRQFMHGEQGALICTAKIVETVPWIDAKYYAATQVMDEARHVEVFAKYLDEKLSGHYPINAHLRLLLDDIVADSRWDMTYLGMQIMVEGLALAAFGFMHQMTTETAAQEAAALRHGRRGPPRRLRRAEPAGVLRGAERGRAARAPGVRLRGGGAHARPLPAAGGVGAHGGAIRRTIVQAGAAGPRAGGVPGTCCSPRSCRTARSSACSTPPTAGSGPSSPRWASSSSRTWVDTSEEYDALASVAAQGPGPLLRLDRASLRTGRHRPSARPPIGTTAPTRLRPQRRASGSTDGAGSLPIRDASHESTAPAPSRLSDRAPLRVGGDGHGHPVRRRRGHGPRGCRGRWQAAGRHGSDGSWSLGVPGRARC